MLTGAQGGFSFDHVPGGPVQILVTKPGFVYHGTSTVSNAPTSIQLGPETGTLVLKLTQAAVIYGHVGNKDEEPLEGASLEVFGVMVLHGRRQLAPVHAGIQPDADGNFRIVGLAPGRYYVAVHAGQASQSRLRLQPATPAEAYPEIVYYPSSRDLDGAAAVSLAAGQHKELRFTLERVPRFTVAGLVGNLASWSRVDPPVFVDEMGRGLLQPNTFNVQSGAFEFNAVPAGSYLVRLGATDAKGRHSVSLHRVIVEANVPDLRFSPNPVVDIPVVVRADFAPAANVPCLSPDGAQKNTSGCSVYPAARVELHSLDFSASDLYSEVSKERDPPVDVPGVVPGKYLVLAKAVFGGYIQSVRCGELDLLREPLVVPEGGRVPPIEVVVRDDASTVTVKVHRDKPDQQVLVLVFSEPLVVEGPQLAVTGLAAEYQSGPIPPGAYKVLAFDASDPIDYSDPDVLGKYASQAITIEVAARQRASVTVDVIRVGE